MTLDAAGIARARQVAEVIDAYVAADVEIATGAVGMGLDAVATALRTKAAETYDDLGPWIALAADVFAYVGTGAIGPALADRFGAMLSEIDPPA
jgi:hypothetical protein